MIPNEAIVEDTALEWFGHAKGAIQFCSAICTLFRP
jgi:hypothetical protein